MRMAAKGLAGLDGGMRQDLWLRGEGMELTGKTVGLLASAASWPKWRGYAWAPARG
jgi:hypothetical protein